jgi:hypothetical protein
LVNRVNEARNGIVDAKTEYIKLNGKMLIQTIELNNGMKAI